MNATISKADLLKMLVSDITRWNDWRKENSDEPVDLTGVSLVGVEIPYANLRRVDFAGSDLSEVDFYKCDLTGANFCDATLIGARYEYCTMSHFQRDLFVAAQDATITFVD